jgi:hypothetical protein
MKTSLKIILCISLLLNCLLLFSFTFDYSEDIIEKNSDFDIVTVNKNGRVYDVLTTSTTNGNTVAVDMNQIK